jgi:hypothetical protein
VLLYLSPPGAGLKGLPIKTLAGFERVFDLTSSSKAVTTVAFNITAYDISIVGTDGVRRTIKGKWSVTVGDAEASAVLTVY